MSQGALSTAAVEDFVSRLTLLEADVSDAERLRQLSALEAIKAAAAAAQARVAVAFDASQRAHQRATGVPAAKVGAGIAEQIALARRESPARGSRHLGLARALVTELPHTLAALTHGDLSEWRATLVAQATAVLSSADRQEVNRRLAGRLEGLSDRHVRAAAQAVAYELDPHSVVDRQSYAASQRRVAIRPAPDAMAYLTALLPVVQAVAVVKCLHEAAGAARAAGDARSMDQVKADTRGAGHRADERCGSADRGRRHHERPLALRSRPGGRDGGGLRPGALRQHPPATGPPSCIASADVSRPDDIDEAGSRPAGVVAQVLRRPDQRGHHILRTHETALRRSRPTTRDGARPVVSHALLWCADQACRPRTRLRPRRRDVGGQCPGAVRAVQPRQRGTRMGHDKRPRPDGTGIGHDHDGGGLALHDIAPAVAAGVERA